MSAATTQVVRDGYVLTVTCDDPSFDPALKSRLIDTFFAVYPAETRAFNPSAAKAVVLSIASGWEGVGETQGTRIRVGAPYFHAHPQDVDVITHEAMHVVQAYPPGAAPGWLAEGIADYARYRFGVNNAAAGWSLPDLIPGDGYTSSYRVTARFLLWIEVHRLEGFVARFDSSLRSGTYRPEAWKQILGEDIDATWRAYVSAPGL